MRYPSQLLFVGRVKGVVYRYHGQARGLRGGAGGGGVFVEGALGRLDPQPLQSHTECPGVPFFHPKLLHIDHRAEVSGQSMPLQGGLTEARNAGGDQGHVLAASGATLQKSRSAGLHGDLVGVGLPAKLQPFRHDGLGGQVQMIEILRDLRGDGEN